VPYVVPRQSGAALFADQTAIAMSTLATTSLANIPKNLALNLAQNNGNNKNAKKPPRESGCCWQSLPL
jgi:hypothetical protein